MEFHLTATAVRDGGYIPVEFTCDGPEISPALAWTDPPAGTKSLVTLNQQALAEFDCREKKLSFLGQSIYSKNQARSRQ